MDAETFCTYFYASEYLPVSWWKGGKSGGCLGFPEGISVPEEIVSILSSKPEFPAVYTTEDSAMYGMVRYRNADDYLIFGPVFSSSLTDQNIRSFMRMSMCRPEQEESIIVCFSGGQRCSYNRFLNSLVFAHLIVNGEPLSVTDHFGFDDRSMKKNVARKAQSELMLARQENTIHGTWQYEQRMLSYVRNGNPEALKVFLADLEKSTPLTEGKLSENSLRQAKDVFVGLVTLAGKSAAVPGGMDAEAAYQLIDTYIQECENCSTLDAIKSMQLNMLLDFASRTAKARMPEGMSSEIYQAVQYINGHVMEHIEIDDIARFLNKSRSYTTARFRAETGMTIKQYIDACKMAEARNMLEYTDKSIAEISDWLNYADQAHFQKVFRKINNVTPNQYRKMKKTQ